VKFGRALAPLVLVAGCAAPPAPSAPPLASAAAAAEPAPYACLLPSEQRMLVAELFFGRDRAGRSIVGDAEWTDFLNTVITPNFPDGLTVFDGYGQSRNPQTGVIGRSPRVKIVLIAVNRSPDLPNRLTAVIEAYKTRFNQRSVGLVTRDSCTAF
jgi:Protein of unknown function (DUF3574)